MASSVRYTHRERILRIWRWQVMAVDENFSTVDTQQMKWCPGFEVLDLRRLSSTATLRCTISRRWPRDGQVTFRSATARVRRMDVRWDEASEGQEEVTLNKEEDRTKVARLGSEDVDCAIRNQRLTSRTGQSSVAQVPAAIQGLEVHPVFCSAASDYDIHFFLRRSCQAFENV